MRFRSELSLEAAAHRIGHRDRILALGSCFADEMAGRLERSLIPTTLNPLGALFNPIALCQLLDRALKGRPFVHEEFFRQEELWRHFLAHSSFAAVERERSVATANHQLQTLRESAIAADHLLLTLGSAWSYRHLETNQEVGHNHRLPLSSFEKRLLSVEEARAALVKTLERLMTLNPRLRILITVSPVKHLRDGLHANNLSKSVLLLAAHELVQTFDRAAYFPAYELLIDDLRDYRFFDADLAHPSPAAIEYIWQRFASAHLDPDAQSLCDEVARVRAILEHRPHHPETLAYRSTLEGAARKIDAIAGRGLDVSTLRNSLNKRYKHAHL